jgi:toxin-antitoxin system PIN domain toxin
VKVVDLNVLLYVVNRSSAHHLRLIDWWRRALDGDESIGLPWIVVLGFLRLTTTPRAFPRPLDPNTAAGIVEDWLQLANVFLVREKDDQWTTLTSIIRHTGTAGNLTTDAHLAAVALTHDAVLVSCDNDFRRFRGLRVENPLE